MSDLVRFDSSYLDEAALTRLIRRADVVLLPYDSREQVTSGVLVEAVAAGKPVVATAFPHAVEMLCSGAGLLVSSTTARPSVPPCTGCSPSRIRPGGCRPRRRGSPRAAVAGRRRPVPSPRGRAADQSNAGARMTTYPEPSFAHLARLSDDTGLLEHARGSIPLREHGYCVDDVARGLVVVCREPTPSAFLIRLAERYLAFLVHAQTPRAPSTTGSPTTAVGGPAGHR